MVAVQLMGSGFCRRYQKMRTAVIQAAGQLGLDLELEEINDPARLAVFSSLSLPWLYIGGQLVASQNPPTPRAIALPYQKTQSK